MTGRYWHSECAGCSSYGIECETGCEYSDDPERCKCFTPLKYDEYNEYDED